eukprot:CFRG8610T1
MLLRHGLPSLGAHVQLRTHFTQSISLKRSRAVEKWLRKVPEHKKEALEFERKHGIGKGIRHVEAPLLSTVEAESMIRGKAKEGKRGNDMTAKLDKLSSRGRQRSVWWSANKAPVIQQRAKEASLQEKIDAFGFDPDNKEGRRRVRLGKSSISALSEENLPMLSSGKATDTMRKKQDSVNVSGSVMSDTAEKEWMGDNYDAELDMALEGLETIPTEVEKKTGRGKNMTGESKRTVTIVRIADKETGTQHLGKVKRMGKKEKRIQAYIDPEDAFYDPVQALKAAKKKANKAATRWKNRGISWALINANLPPGALPGPRPAKGTTKAELPTKVKVRWEPKKRLTRPVMDKIRSLRDENCVKWTTVALADRFNVSPEAIHRILRSRWKPSPEVYERQQHKTFKRIREFKRSRGLDSGAHHNTKSTIIQTQYIES